MPRYNYTVRDENGRLLNGSADGGTVDEIVERLSEKNYIPVAIDELNFDGTLKNASFFDKLNDAFLAMQKQVPYKAVVFFTRQLATMVSAGVPLAQALEQLAESESPVFKRIIQQVAEDISVGSTFSDAIAKHPGAFNGMFVSVIRSGEISGALDEVLDQMAAYMEDVEAMRQKVKGAMRYPMVITILITLMVLGVLKWLVPTFEDMYKSFDAKLPWPTQVLLNISNVVQEQFFFVIAGIIFCIVGFWFAMANDSFKRFIHRYILKVPVFGTILKKNIFARFSRTMALLLDSGTPILQAIEISGGVVGNTIYSDSLEQVYEKLRRGELLSQALRETKVYPVLVTQLVATGEEAGKVDELLRKVAEFYEREIRVVVDSLASIIEPVLIVILGGTVGAILIALYMPIFMIGKVMTKGL